MSGRAPDAVTPPGNQMRAVALGFVFPVALGGIGIAVPVHAALDPSLRYIAYVASIPALLLIAAAQLAFRAATTAPGPDRPAAVARMRRVLMIPFAVVAAALLLSGAGLALGPGAGLPRPVSALMTAAFVFSVIAACFLPLTARARRYDWLASAG